MKHQKDKLCIGLMILLSINDLPVDLTAQPVRQKLLITESWRVTKGDPAGAIKINRNIRGDKR